MIAFLGRLAIRGLGWFGVGEAGAGRFVSSPIFAPIALVVVGTLAWGAALAAIALHDKRVAGQAVSAEVAKADTERAKFAAAALELELEHLRQANKQMEDQLRLRGEALSAFEQALADTERENAELRKNASDPDGLALPDDEWLRAGRASAHRAGGAEGR